MNIKKEEKTKNNKINYFWAGLAAEDSEVWQAPADDYDAETTENVEDWDKQQKTTRSGRLRTRASKRRL